MQAATVAQSPDADDGDGAAGDERPDADGGPLPCACVYASLEGEMAKRRGGRMSDRQRQGWIGGGPLSTEQCREI